ncbi:hypothetical protein [Lacrimispora sp. JR3]|uniref:hypothetical protein n=1 Tax=Lacrimispora sinapis TaxID=3111456 RepID=UPI00374A065B
MSSTNKTSLGLNIWEASDKPVRQDFVNDNVIIDEKISELNNNYNDIVNEKISELNSNLKTIKSTRGLFDNYGALVLNSQEASPSSTEGSEIVFRGLGGNTGDTTVLDCYNNIFRIYGDFGGTTLAIYEFRPDGIYLNGKRVTT